VMMMRRAFNDTGCYWASERRGIFEIMEFDVPLYHRCVACR